MTDQNIFDGNDNPNNNVDPETPDKSEPSNNIPEDMKEWIGEGKKYRTMEDALKSIPSAQEHISRLEKDQKELRQDLETRESIREMLDRMREGVDKTGETPRDELNPDKLSEIVDGVIETRESRKRQAQNLAEADKAFKDKFGDKYAEVYETRVQELGVSKEYLRGLAAESPQAWKTLMGIQTQTQKGGVDRVVNDGSAVNTEGFKPSSSPDWGTYKYYQRMRKENPKLYHDPKTALERHDQAAKLGEDFYK